MSIVRGARANMSRSKVGWKHFQHDADIGICGYGPTPATAFEQAGVALTATITNAEVRPITKVEVDCERSDIELLFVDWLDAVIFEMSVRKMLFGRFAVTLDKNRLHGTLWGEAVEVQRHAPACEPKGATLTELRVARDATGIWSARCVVDV